MSYFEKELTEEERILLHQLLDTITLFLNRPASVEEAKNRVLAQQYLFVDDYRDNPHTLLRICDHFEIDPITLRKQLLQAQLGEIENFNFLVEKQVGTSFRIKQFSERVKELIPAESIKLEGVIRRLVHGRKPDQAQEKGSGEEKQKRGRENKGRKIYNN